MPPWSRMWVSARVSSSRVVMPGRTEACSSSSVRPTSRPAVRMPASCSGVLPSQRSRLNRPMRKTLPAHPLDPHIHRHPPVESREHAVTDAVPAECSLLSSRRGAGSGNPEGRDVEVEGLREARQGPPSPRASVQVLGPQLPDPPPVTLDEVATEGVQAALPAIGVVLALVLPDHSLSAPD